VVVVVAAALGIEVVEAAAALPVDNPIANPLPVELGEDR
jgi:hypothetical protein